MYRHKKLTGGVAFFNSVSVSYIAAFLFYIFQVYIPQVRGEELAKEAIRRDMHLQSNSRNLKKTKK